MKVPSTATPFDRLPELLDNRLAIVGTSGAGKTYAAKGLVERVVRSGARLCIVDPLGVWWGLRAGRDGKAAAGLPVLILGGAHADVPIGEEHGAPIGTLVGQSDIQCVVDLAGLKSKAARQRFMRAFVERLYEANCQPLHLVLDEADLWSPQKPMPDQTVLQGQIGEIVRRGRVRGFVPWLITQRPAVLDKDVLSQADILVAMKLTASQDRAAIGAWIEGQADKAREKQVLADLPSMQLGQGYVWAPAHAVLERVTFPAITTFDSSRTPKRGESAVGAALAPVDAATILAALTSPAALSAPAAGPDMLAALEAARAEGRAEGDRALQQLQAAHDRLLQVGAQLVEQLVPQFAELGALFGELAGAPVQTGRPAARSPEASACPPPTLTRPSPTSVTIEARLKRPPKAPPAAQADPALHPAARAILAVLAAHAPMTLTWRQVGTLAGLVPSGGHWNAGRKQLRDTGLVVEDKGSVWTTDEGIQRAGHPTKAPLTGAPLLALWGAKLPSPAPAMLAALALSDEKPLSREQLAAVLGKKPTGGHWNTGIKALRDNELIVGSAAGWCVMPRLRRIDPEEIRALQLIEGRS